ncbi:MAG: hypothetical protein OXC27_15310 [Caldilineaceae bacterium]|nr:hypothetical protein [Caldilineaceae bacterium]
MYTRDFLQDNIFPFYIYHQFGPQPLLVYMQALVFVVFGYSIASLQGITLVGGALAAPATYWASRWAFDHLGTVFARRVGLIAALGLALSTFVASHSYRGIEPILLPLVELMAIGFLWRGFRRGETSDFVLAGLLVGMSQYVYIVARFFPVALAVATVGAVLANRRLLAHWRDLLWAAAAAALVALPQWIVFVVYPYTFFARVSNPVVPGGGQFVFELPDPLAIVVAKLKNQLIALSFFWQVDHQYGSRTILTAVLVVGLVIGIAVVIRQRREGHVFGFLIMALMLLPELLTYEKYDHTAIDFSRLLPGIPFIFVMAGLGTATAWAWIERRPRFPRWMGYLVLALVLISGLFRQWDFSQRVTPHSMAFRGEDSKSGPITEFIGSELDRSILLPTSLYSDSRVSFLLTEQFPHRQGGMEETLRQGEHVLVILPDSEWSSDKGLPEDWVLLKEGTVSFLPSMPVSVEPLNEKETLIVTKNGIPVGKALETTWQGGTPEYMPLEGLSFANHLDLVGFQSDELELDSNLDVTLFWRPAVKIRRDVELVLELYDRTQDVTVISMGDWPLNGTFRMRAWRPEQVMPLSYSLSVRPNLSAGHYQLQVGLIDQLSRQPIPLVTGQSAAILKTFEIAGPQILTDMNFGNFFSLEGYTLAPNSEGLKIDFYWRAIESPDSDYTLFVHIVNSDDQIVAQLDGQPFNGRYPTSTWPPGELFVEERFLPAVPDGEYRIFIGWYTHQENGWERLSTVAQEGMPATDHPLLGTITLP